MKIAPRRFCVSFLLKDYMIRVLMSHNFLSRSLGEYENEAMKAKLFGIYHEHSDCISELWDLNRTSVFRSPFGYLGLHIMLLDEYQERLFVGGRDLLYSLSLDRISDNYREVE